MIEPLEQRKLLAFVSISASGSVVTINYNNDSDVIEVILSGGNIQTRDSAGSVKGQISASGKNRININAGGGNDFVRIGRGDGSLMPAMSVSINGSDGDDTLIGGNSVDTLTGAAGNDRLDGRAAGDRMEGGAGFDTADYSARGRSINVSLDNSGTANDGSTLGNNSTQSEYNDNGGDNLVDMEAVLGGSNADFMRGNSAANWLDGGGGNDTMFGGAGIDTITGGTAADLAYGEADADFFFFQDSTPDQFLGGAGTTSAQYDSTLDTPAPSIPGAAFAETLKTALLADVVEDEPPQLITDGSFGDDGQVRNGLEGIVISISDVAIQSIEGVDKIIVVGSAAYSDSDANFLIARFNSDGSLDTTFGNSELGEHGVVLVDFYDAGYSDEYANSVVIGSGGKIIVAGTGYWHDDSLNLDASEFAALRLNQDGTLDDDFGSGGKFWGTPDGLTTFDSAARVVIQTVGDEERYVLAGTIAPPDVITFTVESADWGAIRLTNAGSVDTSFGTGGLLLTQFYDVETPTDEYATGLAIDPATNNVWIAGTRYVDFEGEFAVAGYDQNGNPLDGAVNFYNFSNLDLSGATAYDAVITGSRLIVVGQSFVSEGQSDGVMAAFSVDSDNYAERLASVAVSGEEQIYAFYAVDVDNDGGGIVAGKLNDNYYISRFDTDSLSQLGNPIIVDFAGIDEYSVDYATGIAVGSDGSVVVAGVADDPDVGLVRLIPEEPEEPPFVDVVLDGPTVQGFHFFIAGNTADPVPAFLVDRLKSLKPDGTVELSGTEFDDTICVTKSHGEIIVNINGQLFQYNAAQVTKVVINGLGGNDVIKADDCLDLPVVFYGGNGNDLLIGARKNDTFFGGAGHDIIFGLDGDDCMDGEAGNDLLIGGRGNDKLFGGDGRDLLIGGLGSDTLRGGADEDIIIGGFTLYDLFGELLIKLRDEWCDTGHSWSQRFSNIGNPFSRGHNSSIFLLPHLTVFNDKDVDDLGGDGGNDWFFADTQGSGMDKIKDKTSGDKVTSI